MIIEYDLPSVKSTTSSFTKSKSSLSTKSMTTTPASIVDLSLLAETVITARTFNQPSTSRSLLSYQKKNMTEDEYLSMIGIDKSKYKRTKSVSNEVNNDGDENFHGWHSINRFGKDIWLPKQYYDQLLKREEEILYQVRNKATALQQQLQHKQQKHNCLENDDEIEEDDVTNEEEEDKEIVEVFRTTSTSLLKHHHQNFNNYRMISTLPRSLINHHQQQYQQTSIPEPPIPQFYNPRPNAHHFFVTRKMAQQYGFPRIRSQFNNIYNSRRSKEGRYNHQKSFSIIKAQSSYQQEPRLQYFVTREQQRLQQQQVSSSSSTLTSSSQLSLLSPPTTNTSIQKQQQKQQHIVLLSVPGKPPQLAKISDALQQQLSKQQQSNNNNSLIQALIHASKSSSNSHSTTTSTSHSTILSSDFSVNNTKTLQQPINNQSIMKNSSKQQDFFVQNSTTKSEILTRTHPMTLDNQVEEDIVKPSKMIKLEDEEDEIIYIANNDINNDQVNKNNKSNSCQNQIPSVSMIHESKTLPSSSSVIEPPELSRSSSFESQSIEKPFPSFMTTMESTTLAVSNQLLPSSSEQVYQFHHDPFCWICHLRITNEAEIQYCSRCPLSFHRECARKNKVFSKVASVTKPKSKTLKNKKKKKTKKNIMKNKQQNSTNTSGTNLWNVRNMELMNSPYEICMECLQTQAGKLFNEHFGLKSNFFRDNNHQIGKSFYYATGMLAAKFPKFASCDRPRMSRHGIYRPMDLNMIIKKSQEDMYNSTEEYMCDIKLVSVCA